MSYRPQQNYNSHPGLPPERPRLTFLTRDAEMVYRTRKIVTDNTGPVSDSGWSGWFTNFGVTSVIATDLVGRFGSSWTKVECKIETAAGIGRPRKLIWRNRITNGTTGAHTYTSDEEKLFLPGDTFEVLLDAPNGNYLRLWSGAILVIAD